MRGCILTMTGEAASKMLAAIKDWRQTLSWKLGYGRGKGGHA